MANKEKTTRKAHAPDPEQRAKTLNRLRRIEGQIRGLQKMVEEGRECGDVLEQISSAQESLVGVSKSLLKSHLRHCVEAAASSGDRARADSAYDEIVMLLGRHWR
jgi:DNA-binding FrmR family transcriptional regulator